MSEHATPEETTAPTGIDWEHLPTNAAHAAGIVGALSSCWLPAPLFTLWYALLGRSTAIAITLALIVVCAVVGGWWNRRRTRRVRYALLGEGLRIRRGLCFWHEIVLPRSRVQHLDLERGPIERHLGLATLVIHTAGTRMNAVRLAGLNEQRALALRDALLPNENGVSDDAV
ncbi:MAG: PH domain-containing protein [Xanthomonadaceae bacterium]|nr:PH domain-containing protein [Xanthomonadaceae bacterium]MDP2184878.1 PH domain-containing protein [Xanthomonadales bacterium]MDZ4115630.1 PH domain-containing protein [Xanthomonadaceae bacterium]MDZ4377364.1 PH domain-containing protein [Xanthomonadaceae bacterium]